MDVLPEFLRAFVALGLVIILMLLVMQGMKRLPGFQNMIGTGKEQRLKVISSLMLDARHRIVIVKIDEAEKIFLLSPESAMEVKS